MEDPCSLIRIDLTQVVAWMQRIRSRASNDCSLAICILSRLSRVKAEFSIVASTKHGSCLGLTYSYI
jgi:hypothetical protein